MCGEEGHTKIHVTFLTLLGLLDPKNEDTLR
jgi:hypothetical protein